MNIKFGCHGSTWELDYDKKTDYLEQIMDTVQESGFKGVDAQISLLGKFKDKPEQLLEELKKRGLKLAALTLPFSWERKQESAHEHEIADYYVEYLKHFPNAIMNVAPRVGKNRDNLLQRQKEIASCANRLSRRAYEEGVQCSFHPSSPANSYFRTEADYETLFNLLDDKYIGYTPDAGHIAYGGMDVPKIFKKYISIIKHVHFKDASYDPEWKKMGDGEIDFPKIVSVLRENDYKGWIMVEEETKESETNPQQAINDISSYVQKMLYPVAEGIVDGK